MPAPARCATRWSWWTAQRRARSCARTSGVVAALAALPPDQRAAVVLRHLLGYTPGEIARLLDLPRGTVNSRLRRGLDAMRDRLEGDR